MDANKTKQRTHAIFRNAFQQLNQYFDILKAFNSVRIELEYTGTVCFFRK